MSERSDILEQALVAAIVGDVAGLEDVYHEDVTAWAPNLEVSSRADLVDAYDDNTGALDEVEIDLDVYEIGDLVIGEWTATATHVSPLVLDGDQVVDPTGNQIVLRGATFAEFDGDRIRALRQYWDEVGFLEQLGLLDADED